MCVVSAGSMDMPTRFAGNPKHETVYLRKSACILGTLPIFSKHFCSRKTAKLAKAGKSR